MKKARKTKRKKAAPAADPKARTSEEIQRVQNRVTNVILDHSVEMANRVVQSVTEGGHIMALKFLWQTVGLFPGGKITPEDESPDMLAKILLEKMGLEEKSTDSEKAESAEGDVESEEEEEE